MFETKLDLSIIWHQPPTSLNHCVVPSIHVSVYCLLETAQPSYLQGKANEKRRASQLSEVEHEDLAAVNLSDSKINSVIVTVQRVALVLSWSFDTDTDTDPTLTCSIFAIS